mmetsp:Transcript_22084/g.52354  ORF Transcript_22084/g.52354 Transcript_22084/m.52354 type:complete len:228 (-) Transcript_22084:887-1570(-)
MMRMPCTTSSIRFDRSSLTFITCLFSRPWSLATQMLSGANTSITDNPAKTDDPSIEYRKNVLTMTIIGALQSMCSPCRECPKRLASTDIKEIISPILYPWRPLAESMKALRKIMPVNEPRIWWLVLMKLATHCSLMIMPVTFDNPMATAIMMPSTRTIAKSSCAASSPSSLRRALPSMLATSCCKSSGPTRSNARAMRRRSAALKKSKPNTATSAFHNFGSSGVLFV